jgi:DNA-binding beta-propeller fold protein YncE
LRARIAVPGHNPDAIVLDPATSRVLVFDGQSQDMVVIDAISDAVLAVTKMPGKPEFAAIDGATLYVNIEDKNSLAQVDLPNGRVTAVWPLPGCDEPTGLDMDRKTHRVFSVCGNGVLAVTEVPSGRAIATVPIGAGADAVVFLPARGVILSACGQSGTLDVVTEVTPDQYQRVQSLNTAAKARTMAVDAERARVWLPAPSPDGFRLLELAPRAGQ